MQREVVVLAFQGKKSCFLHALLNVVDISKENMGVTLVMEGESLALLKEITLPSDPLHELYTRVKEGGLIGAVCLGCSRMFGVLELARREGLSINGQMDNHVPLAPYLKRGAQIITF